MLLHLKAILTQDEVQAARARLGDDAPWVDGRSSAGGQAVGQKQNHQLAQDSDTAQQLQQLVLSALQRDPLFFSATLPKKIFNPLFNRYTGNANRYGAHVDGAVLRSQQPQQWVRSDISCTLFLSEPESYEGGELVIQHQRARGRTRDTGPAPGELLLDRKHGAWQRTTASAVRPRHEPVEAQNPAR
jgi:PKHD-type hydroxylase